MVTTADIVVFAPTTELYPGESKKPRNFKDKFTAKEMPYAL
jgi:hypothetical protein